MSQPMIDRVRRVVADVLNVPLAEVNAQSSPQTLKAWDSVQHLNLMLSLEQELGVQFDPNDIDHMNDVASIVALAEAKTGGQ